MSLSLCMKRSYLWLIVLLVLVIVVGTILIIKNKNDFRWSPPGEGVCTCPISLPAGDDPSYYKIKQCLGHTTKDQCLDNTCGYTEVSTDKKTEAKCKWT